MRVGLVKKKTLILSTAEKRSLVEPEDTRVGIARQCSLLGLCRSSYYYERSLEREENLRLMERILNFV